MNYNKVRKILSAIELLKDIGGCELEIQSLSHKLNTFKSDNKGQKTGIPFIDCCTDEELIIFYYQRDPRLCLHPFPDPLCFQYLKRNRPRALKEMN